MNRACRRYYIIALCALLAVAAYPVAMGLKLVAIQLARGAVAPEDYTRYVVPYTAVGLSALVTAALYPAVSRLGRGAVPAATALALGLFVGAELYMESITINSAAAEPAVQWQLAMCIRTPDAVRAFQGEYRDVFKIHYFLVAFVILAMTVGVFYGFGALVAGGDRRRKTALGIQLAVLALFLALCAVANFTGFFRGVSLYQPPLSAALTGLFFVVLGASAGIWLGSLLLGRRRALCVGLPAAVALAVCAVMYYGEYHLLGSALYRFGDSFLFRELPAVVLAPVDVLVILLAGAAAGIVMARAEKAYSKRAASPPATPAARGPARA